MTEWLWNEVVFKIKGFDFGKKYPFISPHSIIPSSFLNDETAWKWTEWKQNDISPLLFSFLVILDILGWQRNDRMRRNESVSWGVEKKEFWNTCHSAIIQSFLCHSERYIFSHLKWAWNDSQMTSNYFNRVLSPLRRQQLIKVFWGHSNVIWCRPKQVLILQSQMSMEWQSNDLELF